MDNGYFTRYSFGSAVAKNAPSFSLSPEVVTVHDESRWVDFRLILWPSATLSFFVYVQQFRKSVFDYPKGSRTERTHASWTVENGLIASPLWPTL